MFPTFVGLPAFSAVVELSTRGAWHGFGSTVEDFRAATTQHIGGRVARLNRGVRRVVGLHGKNSAVNALNMATGCTTPLFKHGEQHVFREPDGGQGGVRHLAASLDLYQAGGMMKVNGQSTNNASWQCCSF